MSLLQTERLLEAEPADPPVPVASVVDRLVRQGWLRLEGTRAHGDPRSRRGGRPRGAGRADAGRPSPLGRGVLRRDRPLAERGASGRRRRARRGARLSVRRARRPRRAPARRRGRRARADRRAARGRGRRLRRPVPARRRASRARRSGRLARRVCPRGGPRALRRAAGAGAAGHGRRAPAARPAPGGPGLPGRGGRAHRARRSRHARFAGAAARQRAVHRRGSAGLPDRARARAGACARGRLSGRRDRGAERPGRRPLSRGSPDQRQPRVRSLPRSGARARHPAHRERRLHDAGDARALRQPAGDGAWRPRNGRWTSRTRSPTPACSV